MLALAKAVLSAPKSASWTLLSALELAIYSLESCSVAPPSAFMDDPSLERSAASCLIAPSMAVIVAVA